MDVHVHLTFCVNTCYCFTSGLARSHLVTWGRKANWVGYRPLCVTTKLVLQLTVQATPSFTLLMLRLQLSFTRARA